MIGRVPFYATQVLRAFCSSPLSTEGHQAYGNLCQVTLIPSPPEHEPILTELTHCLSWPLGRQRAELSCWTDKGFKIECCGHGLLCCAASWLSHWGEHGTLLMNGAEVDCCVAEGLIWLGFEALPLQSCEIPNWCKQYFHVEPIAAATAGTENGYMVLQWPPGFEIGSLSRPDADLAQHTSRSLIVTCVCENTNTLEESAIYYRYFAPQYGVSEDAATGSAMRVLANFWQLGKTLTAYQCSTEGGLLFSRIENGKVWIGGYTDHGYGDSK